MRMANVRLRIATLALGFIAVVLANPAAAIVYDYDFTSSDWSTSDITLVGCAAWANDGALTPPTGLGLTPAAGGQVGDAWLNTNTVDARAAWSRMSSPSRSRSARTAAWSSSAASSGGPE